MELLHSKGLAWMHRFVSLVKQKYSTENRPEFTVVKYDSIKLFGIPLITNDLLQCLNIYLNLDIAIFMVIYFTSMFNWIYQFSGTFNQNFL